MLFVKLVVYYLWLWLFEDWFDVVVYLLCNGLVIVSVDVFMVDGWLLYVVCVLLGVVCNRFELMEGLCILVGVL